MVGIKRWHALRDSLKRVDPLLLDCALALLLFGLALGQSDNLARSGLLNTALVGLETLPLTFRRRVPFAVVLITSTAAILHLVAGYHNGFFDTFSLLVAVYSAAAHSPRRQSLAVLFVLPIGLAIALLVDWHNRGQVSLVDIPYNALLFGSSWVLGDSIRARRVYAEQVEERERLLASERIERDRATLAEERARIARELHDIVAHSVSVMVLQANAGERIATARPDQAAEHFGIIQSTGRQALTEMRRLLGVLRGGEADGQLSPQPQLADVQALVDESRQSGLDTELAVEGEVQTLPEAVQLSAYRIVQEALTNTLRHAQASRATIQIRRTPAALEVEVWDDGRSKASDDASGHGLIGMRERVQLFGGVLEAGPAGSGGFRVLAHIPLNGHIS